MTIETFFEGDTVEIFSDASEFGDLTEATTIEFLVTYPDGSTVAAWSATQVDPDDYTDEKYDDLDLTENDIVYMTEPEDLDQVGTYKIQIHIEWSTDNELHGTIMRFRVKAHLEEPVTP